MRRLAAGTLIMLLLGGQAIDQPGDSRSILTPVQPLAQEPTESNPEISQRRARRSLAAARRRGPLPTQPGSGPLLCSHAKGSEGYWSWRQIDGKRCWFKGSRSIPKDQLRWEAPAAPRQPRTAAPAPPAAPPAKAVARRSVLALEPAAPPAEPRSFTLPPYTIRPELDEALTRLLQPDPELETSIWPAPETFKLPPLTPIPPVQEPPSNALKIAALLLLITVMLTAGYGFARHLTPPRVES